MTTTTAAKEGSVILLVNPQGKVAFQLRDDRPDVSYANHWGLFGGWQERDESPEETIVREMQEELGLSLDCLQLKYLWRQRVGNVISYVFHYAVTDELRYAPLSEGQRLEFLQLSNLKHRDVVPWHRDILERYERQNSGRFNPEVP
jgi:8-oxo-dGTP diphosphatase